MKDQQWSGAIKCAIVFGWILGTGGVTAINGSVTIEGPGGLEKHVYANT